MTHQVLERSARLAVTTCFPRRWKEDRKSQSKRKEDSRVIQLPMEETEGKHHRGKKNWESGAGWPHAENFRYSIGRTVHIHCFEFGELHCGRFAQRPKPSGDADDNGKGQNVVGLKGCGQYEHKQ